MSWQTFLGVLGTLAGILGGVYGITRARRTDDMQTGRQTGVMLSELGFIKAGVEDIKTEQREQRRINTEVYSRLSAVEASAKQAHRRLDFMENREEREHD